MVGRVTTDSSGAGSVAGLVVLEEIVRVSYDHLKTHDGNVKRV
jgi:hypothetical protein